METNQYTILIHLSFFQKSALVFAQKRVMLSFVILFLFSACETVVEIDLPVEKPKLVVNSIFNADSILSVNVTKSRSGSEPGFDFEKVENAVVEVLKNKQSLGLLTYTNNGDYRASAKFANEPNAEYTVKVKATGFETAESTEIMPVKPVISSIKVIPDKKDSDTYYKHYRTHFILHDPTESNFYLLKAWLVYQNGPKSALYTDLKNILGQFSPLRSENSKIHVFDDRSFNGKEITFDLDISRIYIGNQGNYSILFELRSINKSYFDYLYSVKRQFADIPLLEPKNLPVANNIKNGLGIFAPYNAVSFSFDVVR